MSRYIDADRIDLKNYLMHKDGKVLYSDDFFVGIKWVIDRIDEMPSIDIVRCKECKYFIDNLTEDDTDEAYDACRWDWKRRIPKPDDFCSRGEREGE